MKDLQCFWNWLTCAFPFQRLFKFCLWILLCSFICRKIQALLTFGCRPQASVELTCALVLTPTPTDGIAFGLGYHGTLSSSNRLKLRTFIATTNDTLVQMKVIACVTSANWFANHFIDDILCGLLKLSLGFAAVISVNLFPVLIAEITQTKTLFLQVS